MLVRAAYFAKTYIVDEIRNNQWSLDKTIHIQKFGGKKTLKFAHQETIGKIIELAKTLNNYFSIIAILEDQETHNKWKQTFRYLDANDSVLKKYPYFISILGNSEVCYIRSADVNGFTLYTRDKKELIIYTLSELRDKIKICVLCEHLDFATLSLEKEIYFNSNTEESKIIYDCQEFASQLYQQLLEKLY